MDRKLRFGFSLALLSTLLGTVTSQSCGEACARSGGRCKLQLTPWAVVYKCGCRDVSRLARQLKQQQARAIGGGNDKTLLCDADHGRWVKA